MTEEEDRKAEDKTMPRRGQTNNGRGKGTGFKKGWRRKLGKKNEII